MKIFFILLLFICPTLSFAQAEVDHWREAISLARAPLISLEVKEQTAQAALSFLRSEFQSEFQAMDKEDLYKKVLSDPQKLNTLIRGEGKYKDLFTEFSTLVSQIKALRALKNCDEYKTYKESIEEGLSSYSPCSEGTFLQKFMVIESQEPGNVEIKSATIPSFIYSENIIDLLLISNVANATYGTIAKPPLVKDLSEIKESNTSLDELQNLEVYKKMNFQADIYQRSVLNAAKNAISLSIRYSQNPLSQESILEKTSSTISRFCQHCSLETKSTLSKRLSHLIKNEQAQQILNHRPASEVAKSLCDKLKAENYPFFENYSLMDLRPSSYLAGKGKVKSNEYQDQRIQALSKVAQSGGEGLLILTESLTNLDNKVPERLRLHCDGSAQDAELIIKASEEAQRSAAEYIEEVNEELELNASENSVDDNIRYLLKTNPHGFGEALDKNPELAQYACSVLGNIKRQDDARAMKDKAVIWGSMVVGTALMATGVFAPAGATIAGASVSMMAIASGTVLGAGVGVYDGLSAKNAKEKSELLSDATFASSDGKLMVFSQEEYKRYQNAKVSAIVNLGLSAVDVGTYAKAFLRRGKTLNEVTQGLEKGIESKNPLSIKSQHLELVDNSLEAPDSLRKLELSGALAKVNPAAVKSATLLLKSKPEYFNRFGKFDEDIFLLEAMRPGSAAARYERNLSWEFKGERGAYKVQPFNPGVKITNDDVKMRETLIAVQEFFDSPELVHTRMQVFEDKVMLECMSRNPHYLALDEETQFALKQDAMEKVLGEMEQKHGFVSASKEGYRPLVLEDKNYTVSEWFEMLRQGQAFNDSAFLPSNTTNFAKSLKEKRNGHGYYTHRLQWNLLMQEIDQNPQKFNYMKGSDIFKKLGDKEFNLKLVRSSKLGKKINSNETLWNELFDNFSGSYSSPEFFRKTHDDYPDLGAWL